MTPKHHSDPEQGCFILGVTFCTIELAVWWWAITDGWWPLLLLVHTVVLLVLYSASKD